MNCLRKKLVSVTLLLSLFLAIFPYTASADYTSIELSPSTGIIYADYTALSVMINTGTDEFTAVDFYLSFTGDVEYMSTTKAAICDNFEATESESGTSVNITCFKSISATDEDPYNGVIATVYFKSIGTGTAMLTFSSVDPNTTTKTGGTYTLSAENNPVPRGGVGGGELPESGLFDDTRGIIGVGVLLMAFGIFFNHINRFALSLIATARLNRERKEEERTDKRRGKLEKKF